ncbi:unnamed protein product [Linum trigynum]|uniref:Uncharacterized protein n=1 Tax=Linum trigynum TaxID=586398 RepID=A0AAV2GHN8_9ROSI
MLELSDPIFHEVTRDLLLFRIVEYGVEDLQHPLPFLKFFNDLSFSDETRDSSRVQLLDQLIEYGREESSSDRFHGVEEREGNVLQPAKMPICISIVPSPNFILVNGRWCYGPVKYWAE